VIASIASIASTAAHSSAFHPHRPGHTSAWLAAHYLLDPEDEKVLPNWSLVMFLMMIYTAIAAPFQLCFFHLKPVPPFLYATSLLVDFGFVLDCCLQFNICLTNTSTGALIVDAVKSLEPT
jgi:hypothetical protein